MTNLTALTKVQGMHEAVWPVKWWKFYALAVILHIFGPVGLGEGAVEVHYAPVSGNTTLPCPLWSKDRITWYKAGHVITEGGRYRIHTGTRQESSFSVLEIRDIRTSDEGVYECSVGPNQHRVRLQVVDFSREQRVVRILEPYDDSLRVRGGQQFMLKCLSNNRAQLQWKHDNVLVHNSHTVLITQALTVDDSQVSLLTVTRALQRDGGTYTCAHSDMPQAADSVTVVVEEEASTGVRIVDPPLTSVRMSRGAPLHLKCSARQGTVISWRQGERVLTHGDSGYSSGDSGSGGFWISESLDGGVVTSLLSGNADWRGREKVFTCFNQNDPDQLDDIRITIKSRDREAHLNNVVPHEIREVPVVMKQATTLNCRLATSDVMEYVAVWQRAGRDIISNHKYNLSRTEDASTLTIHSLDRRDLGRYTCSYHHTTTREPLIQVVFDLKGSVCPPIPDHTHATTRCTDRNPYAGELCTRTCWGGYIPTLPESFTCTVDVRTKGMKWENVTQCTEPPETNTISDGDLPSTTSHVLLRMGQSLMLTCPRGASWSRENSVIYSSDKYNIGNGSLLIKDADPADLGVYECLILTDDGLPFGLKKFNVSGLTCPHLPALSCSQPAYYGQTCEVHCDHMTSQVTCQLLPDESGAKWDHVPSTCFNLASTSHEGQPPSSSCNIPRVSLQTVWCLLIISNINAVTRWRHLLGA